MTDAPLPLFTYITRERLHPHGAGWIHDPTPELVMRVDCYLKTLERLGAKATGMLITLATLSQRHPETGQRIVWGSQRDLGIAVSGGEGGWGESRAAEALRVLTDNGYLIKIPSRGLGRARGSTTPMWILSDSLFHMERDAIDAPTVATPNKGASKMPTPNVGVPKTHDPNATNSPSRKIGTPQLRHLTLQPPHEDDDNGSFIGRMNDGTTIDSAQNRLLALGVIRELTALRWQGAELAVDKYGAHPLAAWLVHARDKNNPGGYIRSQTQKAEWPFYPPGMDSDTNLTIDSASGRIVTVTTKVNSEAERSEKQESNTEKTLPTVDAILDTLAEAGELGREIQRRWIEQADATPHSSPEERSLNLRTLGHQLLVEHNLIRGESA